MTYTEKLPSENCKELIHSFWKFEVSSSYNGGRPFLFEVMPENKLSIVFVNLPHYKGASCMGIQSKRMKREIYPGSVFLGIRINPWINIEGLIEEKQTTANQVLEAPGILHHFFTIINPSQIAADFSDFNLLEEGLMNLSKHLKVIADPLIKYICLQLEEGYKVTDIVKDIPMSIRPVQKQFKKITGLTMAGYRNINRLRNTVSQIYYKNRNITRAAFENGYTDHSHFMNEFKKFMAGTPLQAFLHQTATISHQCSN